MDEWILLATWLHVGTKTRAIYPRVDQKPTFSWWIYSVIVALPVMLDGFRLENKMSHLKLKNIARYE